jgi:SAM-dependent MidA family methyltransferase
MLTIDYGSENGDLYHRRPHGTLRGYFLQQRLEGRALYQYPGRRDLTADVDFRDLAAWAKGETRFQSQREFLLPHVDPQNPADAALLDPSGAGDAFRVWELKRTPS